MGLELVDDLHRADLRRPGERPGGQRRAQHVHRADPVAQRARDLADDVEDVRVGLDDHVLVDRHGAVLADAAEVVAPEVDQHHVLGALLRVGEQRLGLAAVLLLGRRRAGTCRRSAASRRGAPLTLTSGSGEAPAIWKSPNSRKYMYGDGLTVRRPR